MAAADNGQDPKLAELTAVLAEIRERVRSRHPSSIGTPGASEIRLPDLLPILHARDAAYSKVAAIGTVNPRRGGLANSIIQSVKRMVSRALDWHVREQVEFNRSTMTAIEAILDALEQNNRLLRQIAATADSAVQSVADVRDQSVEPALREFRDMQAHWDTWRPEWDRKLVENELRYLHSLTEIQAGFQHRVAQLETNHREMIKAQHADYLGALDRATIDIQKRLWADMQRIKGEYDSLIYNELRLIRQRANTTTPTPAAAPQTAPAAEAPIALDYLKFQERFRGTEEYVKETQRRYVDKFRDLGAVLDLGCGRGEFLELLREAGIPARGIEQGAELVAICREKGLDADQADMFTHLAMLPDNGLGGIFCAQVVEHLPPGRLPELIRLAQAKLRPGGLLAIETPNPECLAIFATHFYLDPTHTRPIPPPLLSFYFEESGFGSIETIRSSPAIESMPSLGTLPAEFRETFFADLDYAVLGRKV